MANIGIAGATGAVGIEIMNVLARKEFPVNELLLFSSERSAGKEVDTPFGQKTLTSQSKHDEAAEPLLHSFFTQHLLDRERPNKTNNRGFNYRRLQAGVVEGMQVCGGGCLGQRGGRPGGDARAHFEHRYIVQRSYSNDSEVRVS